MKKIIFCLILMQYALTVVYAQKIKGKVTDINQQAIPFANVVLETISDSIFITGTVTNQEGEFTLNADVAENKNYKIKISFIGYETATIIADKPDVGTIVLKDATQQLGEVVIKASLPTYKMESDGLNAKIENSVLSRAGTANDVLAILPFIKEEDENISVFGRGIPLIYLNNRLVRDNKELQQLESSNIKEIKVILNPGAQYDASVGSVIRITTTSPVGEGLSGSLITFLRQRRNLNHSEYIDLNYRKGGLDIFGKLNFSKTINEQNQRDKTFLYLKEDYLTQSDKQIRSNTNSWDVTTGLNYSFSLDHSIGIRYNYKHYPKSKFNVSGNTFHYVNEINDDNYTSINLTDQKSHRHYLNTYYRKEFNNRSVIFFNGDYVTGGGQTDQSSDYTNIANDVKTIVDSNSETDYSLYAGKLTIEMPLFGGKTNFGGESSYTDNKQDYEMLNEEVADDLPSNTSTSKQKLYAGFLSYDLAWNKFSMNAGLRYEHIDFSYYENNVFSKEQSRIYNNWFPSLSISYQSGNISSSLSYKTIVRRPNYFNLRSSITYNSPYNYEGGNPSLKPMFTNKFTYLFGWKDLLMEVSYNWIKDNLLFIGEQFEDKAISLFTMVNLEHSEKLDIYANYSPKIDFWRPTFSIGVTKQNLTYKNRTYNKPYYSYTWNNIFQLPKDYQLSLNMSGNVLGNYDVSLYKPSFQTDIRIYKKLFRDKLHLYLTATDIFGTNLERWSMNTGVLYFDKWNDRDNRGINLQITFKFNTIKSKYKGQQATDEINRL